jgi:hypothetical protein
MQIFRRISFTAVKLVMLFAPIVLHLFFHDVSLFLGLIRPPSLRHLRQPAVFLLVTDSVIRNRLACCVLLFIHHPLMASADVVVNIVLLPTSQRHFSKATGSEAV